MTSLETNIFPITNLSALSSAYRLYRIKGLRADHPEYHQNLNVLARKLSYKLKSPVTTVEVSGQPRLVVRIDAGEPPSPFNLVRCQVYLDPLPETQTLDYTLSSAGNDPLRLRFLQFMLQAPLSTHPQLWQPGSGEPFFEKAPAETVGALNRFVGFAVRAVLTPDGGIGLCIDVKNKFVSARPLPIRMNRDQFRAWKKRHFIYHYGHRWYDIQATELADLNVTEYQVKRDTDWVPLLNFISDASQKPIPQELAQLPHDATALFYTNNTGESRAAPTGLCYAVYQTQEPEAQRYHRTTILRPHERREMIHRFCHKYVQRLNFGGTTVLTSIRPLTVPRRTFLVPDYRFGNDTILSVRGTPGAQPVSLDALGRTRAALLRDKSVGFYSTDSLERQYLFLPQSVFDSWGNQYVKDLCRSVDEMFPQEHPYAPIVVTYNDRKPRSFVDQGNAIIEAAKAGCPKPGFGVVMVHHTGSGIRQHDQLAAMVIRKLRELDVWVAVNHSAMGQECYQLAHGQGGTPHYQIRHDKRARFTGYLRGVALNKVLLTNERWPFVLETPLHADVIVGIDVKHNTAGFTVIGHQGRSVRTKCHVSSQRERLLPEQVRKYLVDIISEEARSHTEPIRQIVIHRDGRMYPPECEGARKALAALKATATVAADATLTILEISKSSPAPLRLFDVSGGSNGKPHVENPQVGMYDITPSNDGYLCATGRAFSRAGTVQPLHVKYIEGSMAFEKCLEDLYFLTALTWTRPEDCTRYPISMKLTDRRLGEDASQYDADALEFEDATFEVEANP